MTFAKTLAATALACLFAGPTLASTCTDRITYLEELMEEAAEASISTSTGGQGVAGAREAQAMTLDADELEEPVPYQEEEREEDAVEDAEDAGEGGNVTMQVLAALDDARSLDEQGNTEACEEAVRAVMLDLILN